MPFMGEVPIGKACLTLDVAAAPSTAFATIADVRPEGVGDVQRAIDAARDPHPMTASGKSGAA